MRKVIYIPDRHEDSSNVGGYNQLGQQAPELSQIIRENAEQVWGYITTKIPDLDLEFSKVKVFREGMNEEDHARFYGILNFLISTEDFRDPEYLKLYLETPPVNFGINQSEKIGLYLGFRGASSEVTEGDSYLAAVIAGEELARISLELAENPEDAELQSRFEKAESELGELFNKRDREIAGMINLQLQDGETGILIIGQSHKVQEYLEGDIVFELLDPELQRILDEGDLKINQLLEGQERGGERK